MSTFMKAFAVAATISSAAVLPCHAMSENDVSPQAFHSRLAPYGHWMSNSRWGEVWHPTEVPADFRPYRDGHWENTQEYGTVWVSDYSAAADERGRWGDIVFHYGRWGYDPQDGWVWVPGYTWSPAWVVWRQGAGNIGWFPMPPGAYDGVGDYPDDWAGWYGYRGWYGPAFTDAMFFGMWSFVPAYDIYAPEIGIDIIGVGGYGGFIGRTSAWTRFGFENGHVVNRAIDGGRFRAAFGRDLPAGGRNDFAAHHGPMASINRGEHFEAGHGLGHAAYGAHYGTIHHGSTYGGEHGMSHSAYSHSSSHYEHPQGYGHAGYGEGHEAGGQRQGYGESHEGGGQREGFGSQRQGGGMGYGQHPAGGGMGGAAQHQQTQRSGNSGNNEHHPH